MLKKSLEIDQNICILYNFRRFIWLSRLLGLHLQHPFH